VEHLDGHINRRRWFLFVLLGFSCILILALLSPARRAPLSPVILMNQPYAIPPAKVGFLDRIMPYGKAWAPLWRLRYALFGRKQNITIQNTIIDLTGSQSLKVIDCLPGEPDFADSDGVRVWFLRDAELKELRKRLKETGDEVVLDSSRVSLGDEAEAQLHSGNSITINGKPQQVGFSVDVLPRIHKRTTDLTTIVVYSEAVTNQSTARVDAPPAGSVSIQTNFALGGRFQLPRENAAIFVLRSAHGSTNQKVMALLITPQVNQSKK